VKPPETQTMLSAFKQLSHKALVLGALLFTIFQVTWSFRTHRLALEPDSDDDFYLADAIERVDVLDQHGPIPFVQGFFSSPPHSPFATGVCLLGLMFGFQGLAGPYLVSGILVFILLAEANRLASDLSTVARLVLLAGILLIPFTRLMVVELRPDFAVGLFGAIGCLRLSQMVLRTRRPDIREIGLCSLALGFTLLAKPTFFPHTIIVVGLSIFISLCFRALIENRTRTFQWASLFDRLRPCAWSIGGCMVFALPYYVYGYRLIWDYIVEAVWGESAWRWQVDGGVWGSLQYYLSGAGAGPIGSYFGLFLGIIVVGMVYLFLRGRFNEASELTVGLLLVLTSAAVIVIGGIGNPTFNLTAQLLLTLTAVIALNYLFARLPWPQLQVAAALPLLVVGLFQTPIPSAMDRERLANHGITTKVVDTIESLSAGKPNFPSRPIKVALPGFALLHDSNLWILSHNRGFVILGYELDYLDLETVMAKLAGGDSKLAGGDFVCLSETPNVPTTFLKVQTQLFAHFKTDQEFEFVTRIPFGNQAIWLYRRRGEAR
jgi:hypothetical protein